jgi:segregation and condensation protein B
MEYFGINDLQELPIPKEFSQEVSVIGENTDLKDTETTTPQDGQA